MDKRKRVVMRVELYPRAKDGLAEVCERVGMTQSAALARAVEWFTAQPDVVQAAVLGLYPEAIAADVAKLILKRTGGGAARPK